MSRIESIIGRWVVTYRWWIILSAIALIAMSASGGRFLTFTNNARIFFSKENPQLKAFEALENTYMKTESFIFVVVPQNHNVFTSQTLSMINELTEAAWKIPYSSRVDSITNFQHTRGVDDDLIVEDLVGDPRNLTESEIERIKSIALSEPQLVNRLISSSGHVTGVAVNIVQPENQIEATTRVAAYVRNMMKQFRQKYEGIDLYATGGIQINDSLRQATIRDMTTLIPLMYFILFLILGILLRSFAGTFATLIIIGASMITAMGLAGWLGIVLTPPSANAPTMILTLGMADSIHILTSIFHQLRLGKSKTEAIIESMRINFQPVFLTSATTAIGFLSMNFSDAPPFRDLGNIVAMGVTAAMVFSLILLPALVAVFPIRIPKIKDKPSMAMDRFAQFVIRRKTPIFWGMTIFVIALSLGITRIELNDNFVKWYDESYAFRRATDILEAELTGWNTIEYSLESGSQGGIHDPSYLQTVENFANWYRQQPHVAHVNAITDTIKRLNKNLHGDDPAFYRIPESRELAAQYLLLYEMSLPFGLDLNNEINVGKSATRMRVMVRNADSKILLKMDKDARNWLVQNAPPQMLTHGSSLSMMFSHISKRNIDNMLWASFLALFIISVVIMLAFRIFKLGFIFIIPNMTPAMMAFGIWGFVVGRVGLAISIIAAMTLGIIVDDTIHFISKYLRARREMGLPPEKAVQYAFETVGNALLITTIVLCAGFSVMACSSFLVNSDVGLMNTVTIIFALILDFLFLPTLLMKLEEKKHVQNTTSQNVPAGSDLHKPFTSIPVFVRIFGRNS